jgi:KipI family sensor histidine kinase inhibitor
MTNSSVQRLLPASQNTILVEYPDLDTVLAHFAALEQEKIPGVVELIPAAQTIMVRFDPRVTSASTLAETIRSVPLADNEVARPDPVTIDVVYSGEDLAEVATALDISEEELIERHTAANWFGAFAGFAPGFVYCVGDDPILNVPRRRSPRTRIPAGSVALASNFSAIYPRESPGGWQLIGQTAQPMWDLERDPPAAILPGQPVTYRAVREAATVTEQKPASSSMPWVADEVPHLEVVQSGAQLLLQDHGRHGWAAMGVPVSGAADPAAFRAANRAVGNALGTAVLEGAGGGIELAFNTRAVIAITGARGDVSITTADEEKFAMTHGQPTAIEPGDHVRIGALIDGFRSYLAVRGGFQIEPVLNSYATDTLSGVGPAPLEVGDRLAIDTAAAVELVQPVDPLAMKPGHDQPDESHDVVELRIILGSRTDWFTEESIDLLTQQDWTVTPHSNRVGLRLEGQKPLQRLEDNELPSEGAVTGAIQVPPEGQPVLFLPDHPLTGGYPIIGAVIEEDLSLTAQLAPGASLRFVVTEPFTQY